MGTIAVLSTLSTGAVAVAYQPGIFEVPVVAAEVFASVRDRELAWLSRQVVFLAVPAMLVFTGWGAALRDRVGRLTGGRPVIATMTCWIVYWLILVIAAVPASYFDADLSGGASRWWANWLTTNAVGVVVVAVASVPGGWLLRRAPRHWWLWGVAATIPLAALVLLMQPMGRDLQSIADPKIEERFRAIAVRAGAPDVRIRLQPSAADIRCGAGHAVGLGPTRTVVIKEALLDNYSPAEVDLVLAHELKHYVLRDDWRGFFAAVAVIVAGFSFVALAGSSIIRMASGRLGFTSFADPAAFPLLILLGSGFWLAAQIPFNAYARHVEREADRFSLELTRDNVALAGVMKQDLACGRFVPERGTFAHAFLLTHPTIGTRLRFARDYRPWENGQPERYAHRFQQMSGGGITPADPPAEQ